MTTVQLNDSTTPWIRRLAVGTIDAVVWEIS